MAMKYTKNTTEKLDIKGIINEDATTITYEVKEGKEIHEETVAIQDFLNLFASSSVQLTLQTKTEEELSMPIEDLPAEDID